MTSHTDDFIDRTLRDKTRISRSEVEQIASRLKQAETQGQDHPDEAHREAWRKLAEWWAGKLRP